MLPDEVWSAENKGYLTHKEDNSPEYITKMVNDEYKMDREGKPSNGQRELTSSCCPDLN